MLYDIYVAVEGQQSLYSPSGILDDMLELEKDDRCCVLEELMDEAEASWKKVLKGETIASLSEDINSRRFTDNITDLKKRVEEQMVRSEEHTSELQSRFDLVCRLLLEKKNTC